MAGQRISQRIRRALPLLLLLAASVSLFLAAIELLLRWNVIPNEYYVQNQVLGDTNKKGLLLLILGDSFVAPLVGGDLVDLIDPKLVSRGMRIRNTAKVGTGPVEYLERLRAEGPRYRPDIVLLSFYVGNDLLNVGCGGNLDERLRALGSAPVWMKSYLVQFVMTRLRAMFPDRVISQSSAPGVPLASRPRQPRLPTVVLASAARVQEVDYAAMRAAGIPESYIEAAKAGKVNPWIVSLGAQYPDYFRDALLVRSDCAQRAWEDTKRVLDLIMDEAAKLNARVMPVVFPHSLQVTTAHYALYRAWKLNIDDEMLRSSRPQQLLREYFVARGVEPLDLLEAFRNRHEMLFWDQDEHLNGRGQEVAANLIAEAVLLRYGNDGKR